VVLLIAFVLMAFELPSAPHTHRSLLLVLA